MGTELETIPVRSLGTASFEGYSASLRAGFGDIWLGHLGDGSAVGHEDGRNILVVAGPRSGKGTSFIIPNLLLWPGSAFINDPKGENALVTARPRGGGSAYARGLGQLVGILDPLGIVNREGDDFEDLKVRINPLDFLSVDREESVGDAARLGDAIVAPEEASGDAADWKRSSSGAIAAVILHVVSSAQFTKAERTLTTVRRLLLEGDRELAAMMKLAGLGGSPSPPSGLEMLFESMSRNPAFGGNVAQRGAMYLQTLKDAPKQLTGMLMAAREALNFLNDMTVQRMLSETTFSIDELKTNPLGASFYFCTPQRYMDTHSRLVRMLVSLILSRMEEVRGKPATGHPVLMVLDEFAGLGRMRPIETAAAQINAHGVKLMFVVQTLAQLKDAYKDNWETLVATCGTKLFFNNEDHFTRDYVSRLAGETEVVRHSRSQGITVGRSTTRSYGTGTNWNEGTNTGNSQSVSISGGSSWGPGGGSANSGYSSTAGNSSGRSQSEGGNTSYSNGGGDQTSETNTVTETIHKRFLLNPDEVGTGFGDSVSPLVLALLSGRQPLVLRRRPYFSNPPFEGRFDPHPDHPLPRTLAELAAVRSIVINVEPGKPLELSGPTSGERLRAYLAELASWVRDIVLLLAAGLTLAIALLWVVATVLGLVWMCVVGCAMAAGLFAWIVMSVGVNKIAVVVGAFLFLAAAWMSLLWFGWMGLCVLVVAAGWIALGRYGLRKGYPV